MVIRRKAGGFTLAEILITLVIIGFVGALGIPMLGQTKLKKPVEIKAVHGTMECFYSGGYLWQYEANNGNNKTGKIEQRLDGACYFAAPTANFFVMQAIGAGGGGAVGMIGSNKPWYRNATVEISGNIPVNESFLLSITDKDVPDWVRKEWNKQWNDTSKYVEYELDSPLGASGNGACLPMRLDSYENHYNDCSMECVTDIDNCPEYCITRFAADGGNSGKGARYTVRTKIYFEPDGIQDYISWVANTDETTLKVGDRYITLKPSGTGQDGVIEYSDYIYPPREINGERGEDFQISNYANTYFEMSGLQIFNKQLLNNAQKGGKGCGDSNKAAAPGKIKSTTGDIPYYTESLAIEANFGLAGTPGESVRKVLEKLPKGTLFKLVPAENNSTSSKLYIQDEESGNWQLLMVAQSGSDSYTRIETIPVEKGDLPFPRIYYPDAFRGQTPELLIATGAGYESYINRAYITPGRSGSGSHPIVSKVEGTAVHSINGVITGHEKLDSLSVEDVNSLRCFDTSQPGDGWTAFAPEDRVCGQQWPGDPGAIVIAY